MISPVLSTIYEQVGSHLGVRCGQLGTLNFRERRHSRVRHPGKVGDAHQYRRRCPDNYLIPRT